jgi:hypothetical protein
MTQHCNYHYRLLPKYVVMNLGGDSSSTPVTFQKNIVHGYRQ